MFGNSALSLPAPAVIRDVLATLAHELRNPLHSVILALELHAEDGTPDARKTLSMAARQARARADGRGSVRPVRRFPRAPVPA